MKVISKKVLFAVVIAGLMSMSGIYAGASSTPISNNASASVLLGPSVISAVTAKDIASSISNLMEKLGNSINSTALGAEIVSDGSYVTGSALFNNLYEHGDSFYWTVAFNTSDPSVSSINFLFPGSVSDGPQPVENFFQISFPLYSEISGLSTESTYSYSNFSTPVASASNSTGPGNWAGYEFYNNEITSPDTINYVEATVNVPKLSYPPSSQNLTSLSKEFFEWIGLSKTWSGGGGLLQTGVGIHSATIPNKYELWWEDAPSVPSVQPYNSTSYAAPGNLLILQVENYITSTGSPYAVQYSIYDRNTSMDYVQENITSEYTYYAQYIVESNYNSQGGYWQLPQFSPAVEFAGGVVALGNNLTEYGITTLFNDSYYTSFYMDYGSGQSDNIANSYTMKWQPFGDVDEYGYPTLTWQNSYV